MIVIDLVNGDDIISIPPEETPEEKARKEKMRQEALKKIFERAPRPQLEIAEIKR
jgi:hypothetical protein